jgi:PAS domain S-box-containing protein
MAKVISSSLTNVVERLTYSEERFRLLVESVQDYALFMLDPAGRVASWNEGARRMKGYRSEEIVGRHMSQFYTREDVESGKPDTALKEATSTGRFEDEGWRVRKDGSRFQASVIITAIRDKSGELRGFGKVTHDLTERIRAMQHLRESDARLQAFMRYSPSLMFIKDLEGRYQYVNDQFCHSFGLERDAVLERTDAEIFPYAQASRFQANDLSAIATGIALEFEETSEYQNGQHVSIVCKFPICDADGRITALGGVVTDITERKRVERELLDMQRRVAALTQQAKTNFPAESKSEPHLGEKTSSKDMDALALMISRDLRPPLRNIETLAVQLQDGMAEMSAMAMRMDRIARSAAGLTRLTDDLLMFSRSGRLHQRVHRTADLDSVVADARKALGAAACSRRIHWNIGKLPQAAGDPALLRVVFEKILSNAVKFTQQRDPAVIQVAASLGSRNEVVIEIRDNGVGFNEQHAHRLFKAFQRLHGSNQFDGTGIGLATAKRIVECHGGCIWAKSRPGEGTSFYFTLQPAAPPSGVEEHS